MKEIALEFRRALAFDRSEASGLLAKYPQLIDYPVYGDDESAVHFFATENQLEAVSWLLDRGAKPDGIADDDSPMHAAAGLGHEAVCHALLSAGANPNSKDYVEETPLHKASCHGHLEIIELLLNAGGDPSIAEMCGELPVDQALRRKADQVKAVFDRHATSTGNHRSGSDRNVE